jgi:hypothetical protein
MAMYASNVCDHPSRTHFDSETFLANYCGALHAVPTCFHLIDYNVIISLADNQLHPGRRPQRHVVSRAKFVIA